eukprot:CAMPEP_0196576168 /NCGR_PEP_ID=MMETSP1081-20130531/5500_1 /TAXON_ID=36882 /ORGANISM="Pyramimonas amylifera, Strain CCMP720" /LENGTH=173 /DNA_ID=CAMNT_0041894707 /DNA_START=309 /DNA_END=830 /DNA_ORIENTATION=+
MLKSMITTASLGMTGDVVAQVLRHRSKSEVLKKQHPVAPLPGFLLDTQSFFKMATFGFFYYGPLQGVWYPYINNVFPAAGGLASFAWKVFLNQAVLGPLVVGPVFAWTLCLEGRMDLFKGKLQHNMLPTLQAGWKFWIPAASINFWLIPLNYQILYMSSCGIVWNAILSAASA